MQLPDRTLGLIADRVGWLASWPVSIVWLCVVTYAAYLLCAEWSSVGETASVILQQDNWIWLAVAWFALKVLHETAHGIACKIFGGTVPRAGVAIIFFAPLAFVDVTSSWRFRSKWQRIATAAAGMYAELFVAALSVIVASQTSAGWTHSMAINVAATAGVTTVLFNANPLVRFDGYYIISDLFNLPNLSGRGQKLANCSDAMVPRGRRVAASWTRPQKVWLVGIYAVGAFVWRVVFYVTIAAALIAWFAECGVALAILMLALTLGLPTIRYAVRLSCVLRHSEVKKSRVAWVSIAFATISFAFALVLFRPARVSAPAVVEYSPLTIIRADAPGFVEKLCVTGGQQVAAGQVIAQLRMTMICKTRWPTCSCRWPNPSSRSAMHDLGDERNKGQIESARRNSLNKKLNELRHRVDSLTIRAPSAGTIVAKDLDAFRGRYLATGTELVVLGSDDRKEIVIAVPQDDVDLFHDRAA